MVGLINGLVITFKENIANEEARIKVNLAIDGVMQIGSSLSLCLAIVNNIKAESREELAKAYKIGDCIALGKVAGEMLLNFIVGGVGDIGKPREIENWNGNYCRGGGFGGDLGRRRCPIRERSNCLSWLFD